MPEILSPIFTAWRSSGGRMHLWSYFPRPSSRGPRRGGTRRRLSPTFSRWRSSRGRMRLRTSFPQTSSRGPCEGRTLWRSSPKYSRSRSSGGRMCLWTSFPPSLVVWPSSGRDAPAFLSLNVRVGSRPSTRLLHSPRRASSCGTSVRERDAAINPPPNIRGGCRPGGGCASGTPLAEPSRVAFFGEGDATIDPPPDIRSTLVVRGSCAPLFLLPPNLVARPSSVRGRGCAPCTPPPNICGLAVVAALSPSTLVPWPPSGRETSAILPQLITAWR